MGTSQYNGKKPVILSDIEGALVRTCRAGKAAIKAGLWVWIKGDHHIDGGSSWRVQVFAVIGVVEFSERFSSEHSGFTRCPGGIIVQHGLHLAKHFLANERWDCMVLGSTPK